MKYIDYRDYTNLKKNRFDFITKYKINNNNKKYLVEKINKMIKINDYYLDKDQKEAIFTDEINTLVLAGAGSGKTLTICAKINYLINELHVKTSDILCLSFTNDSLLDIR